MTTDEHDDKAPQDHDWRDDLAVFPVEGKQPLVPWRTQSAPWQEWTGRWPRGAGFGVDCGKSGLVVLDEDEPGAVEKWLGYWPLTHTVRTGKGRHFYFRARPGGPQVRNGVRVAPGVDVRAEGGYVVGAGSRHPSGAVYVAENSWRPAKLPDDVLARLLRAKGPAQSEHQGSAAPPVGPVVQARLEGLALKVRDAPAGGGNNTLNWAAGVAGALLADRGDDEQERAKASLLAAYLDRATPHTAVEGQATIDSGWRYGLDHPEAAADRPRGGPAAVAPLPTAVVPPLPADIERCPDHPGALQHGCTGCIVSRAQVERYGRARAVARESLALASPDAWRAVDVAAADDLPPRSLLWIEPAAPGGERVPLLTPGMVSGMHGVTGSAKTRLAHIGVAQEVQAEHLVLIVDHEMRRTQTKAALLDCGLSLEQIRQGVIYFEDPPAMTDTYFDRLMEQVQDRIDRTGWLLTLGVYDSVSRSMGKVVGWTTNDEQHVNAWYDSLPRRVLREFPMYTPLTLDHPGRTDGPDSIGSHAKGAGPDFRVWLNRRVKFTRAGNGAGRSVLQVVKDRAADPALPLDTDLAEVVAVDGRIMARMLPAPEPGTVTVDLTGTGGRPPWAAAADGVLSDLRAAGPAGLMTKEVTGSGGFHKARRAALDRLEEEGLVVNVPDGRAGSGRRWRVVEGAPTTD